MLIRFIENLGEKTINYYIGTIDFISFVLKSVFYIFKPSAYTIAARERFVKQLYLTTLNILPLFIFLALFLGSVLIVMAIAFALNFNLKEHIGTLLVSFFINEFAPLFTTLFIILQYGLFLHGKISSIKDKVRDRFGDIYVPKILSGIIAVPSMSLLFATIMLTSGYIVSSLYLNIDLDTYKNLIVSAISLDNIIILLFKGVLFGFISMIIPIYYVHRDSGEKDNTEYILKILFSLFISIFLIEILLSFVIY